MTESDYDTDFFDLEKLSPKTRSKKQRALRVYARAQKNSLSNSDPAKKFHSTPKVIYKGGVKSALRKGKRLSSGGKHSTLVEPKKADESPSNIDQSEPNIDQSEPELEIDSSACDLTPPGEYLSPNESIIPQGTGQRGDSISSAADEVIQQIYNDGAEGSGIVADATIISAAPDIPAPSLLSPRESDREREIASTSRDHPICASTYKSSALEAAMAGAGNSAIPTTTSGLTPPQTPLKNPADDVSAGGKTANLPGDASSLHTYIPPQPNPHELVKQRQAITAARDWLENEGKPPEWEELAPSSLLEPLFNDCSVYIQKVRTAWSYYESYMLARETTETEMVKTQLLSIRTDLRIYLKQLQEKEKLEAQVGVNYIPMSSSQSSVGLATAAAAGATVTRGAGPGNVVFPQTITVTPASVTAAPPSTAICTTTATTTAAAGTMAAGTVGQGINVSLPTATMAQPTSTTAIPPLTATNTYAISNPPTANAMTAPSIHKTTGGQTTQTTSTYMLGGRISTLIPTQQHPNLSTTTTTNSRVHFASDSNNGLGMFNNLGQQQQHLPHMPVVNVVGTQPNYSSPSFSSFSFGGGINHNRNIPQGPPVTLIPTVASYNPLYFQNQQSVPSAHSTGMGANSMAQQGSGITRTDMKTQIFETRALEIDEEFNDLSETLINLCATVVDTDGAYEELKNTYQQLGQRVQEFDRKSEKYISDGEALGHEYTFTLIHNQKTLRSQSFDVVNILKQHAMDRGISTGHPEGTSKDRVCPSFNPNNKEGPNYYTFKTQFEKFATKNRLSEECSFEKLLSALKGPCPAVVKKCKTKEEVWKKLKLIWGSPTRIFNDTIYDLKNSWALPQWC